MIFGSALHSVTDWPGSGGVQVLTPDVTTETFVQNRTTVAPVSRPGLDVVFVENLHDPNPTDEHPAGLYPALTGLFKIAPLLEQP
jgi:hypothetical protein